MRRIIKIICSIIAGLLAMCALLILLGTVGAYELGNISFIWFCIGFAICIAMAGGSVLLQLWMEKKEESPRGEGAPSKANEKNKTYKV